MKSLRLVAGLVAVIASPALAADWSATEFPSIDDLPDPVVDKWSGFYAGVFAGYGDGTATSAASVTQDIDVSGAMVGGAVGANFQLDGVVLGVEGDIAWSGVEGAATCEVDAFFECGGTLDWLSTLRGRAGLALDGMLFYATAGVAVGGLEANVTPTPLDASGEYSEIFVGWSAGIGAELKLTETISARAEYLYTDLGSQTAPAGTISTFNDAEVSASLHALRLGLNFAI